MTSQLQIEASGSSFSKPSSSEPILGSIRKLNSKATGFFPTGTLTSKKKNLTKTFSDPNKISVVGLKDMGSIMGLEFPILKKDRQVMYGDLAKSHVGLIIEDVEESLTDSCWLSYDG